MLLSEAEGVSQPAKAATDSLGISGLPGAPRGAPRHSGIEEPLAPGAKSPGIALGAAIAQSDKPLVQSAVGAFLGGLAGAAAKDCAMAGVADVVRAAMAESQGAAVALRQQLHGPR